MYLDNLFDYTNVLDAKLNFVKKNFTRSVCNKKLRCGNRVNSLWVLDFPVVL